MNTLLKHALEAALENAREYTAALEKLIEDPAVENMPEVASTDLLQAATDQALEERAAAVNRAGEAVGAFVYGPGGPQSPRFMRLQQDALDLNKVFSAMFLPINSERERRHKRRAQRERTAPPVLPVSSAAPAPRLDVLTTKEGKLTA